jgi:NTE family protein
MQHLEPHKLIASSSLFRGMSMQEAEAVLARLQPAHYAQGAYILERGKWHGCLYLIAAGQVSVLLCDPPAEQENHAPSQPGDTLSAYVVARLGPGECFGEMSLITGEPPSASVRATQDTSMWFLTQADFLALITTCPSLLQNINGILSQRLVRANQHLAAQHVAEIYLLTHEDIGERNLVAYIAEALAWRSMRRVLLLELCGSDVANSSRIAAQPGQLRPSLLACLRDSTLLQAHRGSTLTPEGQSMIALAALDETQEQIEHLDADLLLDLSALSLLYDFIVLVATEYTPAPLLSTLMDAPGGLESTPSHTMPHIIQLVSAHDLDCVTKESAFSQALQTHVRTVFVTHTPAKPTVGMQDRYARLLGQSVTRILPADDALLAHCWEQHTCPRRLVPDAPLSVAIDFVARFMAHQTVGIAFGGGAARGFAHLGVLERLLANRVPLDYMAACSSGIIAPGMFLIGKTLAEIEEIFLQIQQHLVKWNIPRTAIFSNRGLKRMLQEICGEQRFEDLTIPFAMVAADLTTRAGVVLDRGLLWQAGLASVALPGIFPPVMLGEHILIDAGMHDPVPVRLVRQMGAHILLASELGGQEPPDLLNARTWQEQARQQFNPLSYPTSPPSPHIIDVILRTYDLAMATVGMYSVREADVVFRPRLHRVSLRQFSAGRKFISAGRDAVEEALPQIRRYLPSL